MDSLNSSQIVFHGKRFDVCRSEFIGKEGKVFSWEAIIHPGAVVILPLLDNGSVLLIKNERFAVGETLWELPAGTREPNEEPEATAHRELAEETGYQAGSITPLLTFYTSPGFCNEKMYAFVARGLHFIGQDLDESENITVETFSWEEILHMIYSGQIHDGKTLATLLYFNVDKGP